MTRAAPALISVVVFAACWFAGRREQSSAPATAAIALSASHRRANSSGEPPPAPDSPPPPPPSHSRSDEMKPPNVLFLLTDDQDYLLQSTRREVMPKLHEKIISQGVTVEYAFATTPECCPSRATILTGRYYHNHRVVNNTGQGNCASMLWTRTGERATIAVHLQRFGYETYFVGKYMNEYGEDSAGGEYDSRHDHASTDLAWVPPGWSEWFATGPTSTFGATDVYYWNYSVSDNGVVKNYPASGGGTEAEYSTNVWGARALAHLEDHDFESKPFFLHLSFTAPHGPSQPSPHYVHEHELADAQAPRTPNWDLVPETAHTWVAQSGGATGAMNATQVEFVDYWYRRRLLTLRSVDDVVGALVAKLEDLGEIDNTYVFYTSDHGFHLGQFAMIGTKDLPYDTDTRVPFFVRGPRLPPNVTLGAALGFAALVDLAPTWYDLAGGDPSSIGRDAPGAPPFDGTSLLPMLEGRAAVARADVIMEHQGQYSTGCSINGGVVIGAGPLCDVLGPGALAGPPYFEGSDEQFCKCHDAGNNSWACVRTLTSDLNRLFCRIGTSPLDPVHMRPHYEEYDLASDPWAITNRIDHLSDQHINLLIARVDELQHCVGFAQCSSSNVTSRIERAYSENRALWGS